MPGLVNNLNDGLVWVVLPVLLVSHGVSIAGVGYIKALYPFMWAAGMIGTGHLADRIGRKLPIVAGMLIQAAGLAVITIGISHALPLLARRRLRHRRADRRHHRRPGQPRRRHRGRRHPHRHLRAAGLTFMRETHPRPSAGGH